jgi:hypothetical protein
MKTFKIILCILGQEGYLGNIEKIYFKVVLSLNDGSNSISLRCHLLGLQAQSDATREVFPTRVSWSNYQTL